MCLEDKIDSCEHKYTEYDEVHGETVCKECNVVLSDNEIDLGPEWKSFDSREEILKSRASGTIEVGRHDLGISTEIGFDKRDCYGVLIPTKNKHNINKMRILHNRCKTKNNHEYGLVKSLQEIKNGCQRMSLPNNVFPNAVLIYKNFWRKEGVRGRNTKHYAIASIYIACRQNNTPLSINEVIEFFDISRKKVNKAIRNIKKNVSGIQTGTQIKTYCPKLYSRLELPLETCNKSNKLIDLCIKTELFVGRNPLSIIGASIYIAGRKTNHKKNQKEIAEILGITEVTIRNRYKEMVKKFDITF